MLIATALAADFTPGTGSSGGGIALLVIIGIVIAFFLISAGLKRLRRREP